MLRSVTSVLFSLFICIHEVIRAASYANECETRTRYARFGLSSQDRCIMHRLVPEAPLIVINSATTVF